MSVEVAGALACTEASQVVAETGLSGDRSDDARDESGEDEATEGGFRLFHDVPHIDWVECSATDSTPTAREGAKMAAFSKAKFHGRQDHC